MPNLPDDLPFFDDPFSRHLQSVAQRLRRRGLAAVLRQLQEDEPAEDQGPDWLDLTPDSTEAEIDAAYANTFREPPPPRGTRWLLRSPRSCNACPLTVDWKRWDIFVGGRDDFRRVPAADRTRCDAARRVRPIAHNGRLKLSWSATADSSIGLHTPDHIHSGTTVDAHQVHIDRIELHRHSPGRTLTEVRIFVDGALAGRAGSTGCSLGFGGSDLPAVARIGRSTVVTVDVVHGIAFPIVESWSCASRTHGQRASRQ